MKSNKCSQNTSSLENALNDAPCNVTKELAIAHVTFFRHFSGIVQNNSLDPEYCDVFNSDVLYFSYGLAFYKPEIGYTQDRSHHPFVIFLKSESNALIDCYYPYDTGAMNGKRYGPSAKDLSRYLDYNVKDPKKLVSMFYGSNNNYILGKLSVKCPDNHRPRCTEKGKTLEDCPSNHQTIRALFKFLDQDITKLGVDQRHRTIECITENKVKLKRSILMLAYPMSYTSEIVELLDELLEQSGDDFEIYEYSTQEIDHPGSMVDRVNSEYLKRYEVIPTNNN